ncbi:MAG: hypothetical protein QOF89_5384 [Acidobacteriota bacterium]|jgi:predicted transcriptional regulator|nr:hypothetical protein [Acidobacteriota bacterium]
MQTLTIRLTEELEQELEEEARLSHRPSAELAEKAIVSFLEERRRERFREALAHAADELGRDRETLDLAEELLPLDNEALFRRELLDGTRVLSGLQIDSIR